MSESTLLRYLNKCQRLQKESQRCDFVIDYNKTYHGFQVTLENNLTAHSWLFDFADFETNGELEQTYKELHDIYTQLESHEQ